MPISDCEVRDPRIRRTRQLLQGALRELMQTKNFDEVSVQDITDAATVNRATFYDHYTDKFALLEAMVAGGFHRMLEERAVRYDGSCPSAAGAVILAACDYLMELESAEKVCQRQSAFQPLVDAAITRAIGRVLAGGIPGGSGAEGAGLGGAGQGGAGRGGAGDGAGAGPRAGLVSAAASWAIYGAVKEWFGTAERVAPEEMVGAVLELVVPLLRAGARVRGEGETFAAHASR